MLTKAEIARIRGLHKSAERRQVGLFIAEGVKLVRDMLGRFACDTLVVSTSVMQTLRPVLEGIAPTFRPRHIYEEAEGFAFERISTQRTPQPALAVFHIPKSEVADLHQYSGLILLLDNVQDPGNMGTIIRSANWFGVQHLILTEGCADPFSPKVVQATMGALSEVQITRLDAPATEFLSAYRGRVYGTFLDGANIYTEGNLPCSSTPALLIMGNEGQGISPKLEPYITHRLLIPPHKAGIATESLNVGIATAICLSEFSRSTHSR